MQLSIALLVPAFLASLAAALPDGTSATSASMKDWARKFPYKAPGRNDVRSPCPGLNTLANHGFLPRDGKGLTPENIVKASLEAYNVQADVVLLPAKIGFTTSDGLKSFTLGDIRLHDSIEHDASVSRGDIFFGDNFSFNETLYQALATQNPGKDYYDAVNAGDVQRLRLQHSLEHNPETKNTFKEFIIRTRETSLYLAVMGADLTTGRVPKKHVDIFFREERLPIAEGWKRPGAAISGESLGPISDIIAVNSQWTANQTQEATVTMRLNGDDLLTI